VPPQLGCDSGGAGPRPGSAGLSAQAIVRVARRLHALRSPWARAPRARCRCGKKIVGTSYQRSSNKHQQPLTMTSAGSIHQASLLIKHPLSGLPGKAAPHCTPPGWQVDGRAHGRRRDHSVRAEGPPRPRAHSGTAWPRRRLGELVRTPGAGDPAADAGRPTVPGSYRRPGGQAARTSAKYSNVTNLAQLDEASGNHLTSQDASSDDIALSSHRRGLESFLSATQEEYRSSGIDSLALG
jgi:hypothetical protein